MPLYRHADRIVYFSHIPKTGGSTVEYVLRKSGAQECLRHPRNLGFSRCTPQHAHAEIFTKFVPRSFFDYSFAVVRNPYARIASEYKWRLKLADRPLPEFDQWLAETLETAGTDPYHLDNHIRPQSEFISTGMKLFKLEDGLEKPVAAALRKLKIKGPGVPLRAENRSGDGRVSASDRTLAVIASFYAADFERFGYRVDDVPRVFQSVPAAA